jgi:GxxExxY protein
MTKLLLKEEVFEIVGAALEVHNNLGCGFLEPVYQEALEIEFDLRKIPFTPQKQLPVSYKDHHLKKTYLGDFIAYEQIVVEIKALNNLSPLEESQPQNYLKAGNFEVGVLNNFGTESLQWKRKVLTKS